MIIIIPTTLKSSTFRSAPAKTDCDIAAVRVRKERARAAESLSRHPLTRARKVHAVQLTLTSSGCNTPSTSFLDQFINTYAESDPTSNLSVLNEHYPTCLKYVTFPAKHPLIRSLTRSLTRSTDWRDRTSSALHPQTPRRPHNQDLPSLRR